MIFKHISTRVRRKKVYDTECYFFDRYCNNMVGMNIQFKVFGLFWITGIHYYYDYFKKPN